LLTPGDNSQSKRKNVRRYLERPGEKSWAAVSTFETRRRGKPHILIRLVSDCNGETRLVKYELIAMTSHMIAMLKSQSFPQHPIVPVRFFVIPISLPEDLI
jgi:hypothetical protein